MCMSVYVHTWGHIPKLNEWIPLHVRFKFSHMLKLIQCSAQYKLKPRYLTPRSTEWDRGLLITPISLRSATDRLRLEWEERATARLRCQRQRQQEQRWSEQIEVRQARLDRRLCDHKRRAVEQPVARKKKLKWCWRTEQTLFSIVEMCQFSFRFFPHELFSTIHSPFTGGLKCVCLFFFSQKCVQIKTCMHIFTIIVPGAKIKVWFRSIPALHESREKNPQQKPFCSM